MEMMQEMAVDALAFVTGGAPVVNAAKEFDRFMKSYEFAIEAQQLKREDVRDLVELIVDRMDMYHLIGALLLEFCVAFYGEFKVLEEKEEPLFVLEIFLLSNISAIGYLLFAVWLSLHASVAAHAIGVEFLLESSRLTIPTPENLREMRQSTSLFRQVFQMFEDVARDPSAARQRASAQLGGEAAPSPDTQIAPLLDVSAGIGPGKFPLALEQAFDPKEHRHRFAESHNSWLRFDAYSRVCMALGINQMLQAMSYFIVGPIQVQRPTSALLTLVGVQVIALLLLKLDLRKTDIEEDTFGYFGGASTDEDEDSDEHSPKDASSRSWGDLCMVTSTYTLAPLWTTLMLWANRFITEDRHQHYLLVAITPVFLLHALWLFFVLRTVRPHEGDLLPLRLRTVGYLNIFTQDRLDPDHPQSPKCARYDKDTPHGHRTLVGQTTTAMKSAMSAESVPWLVVNRFTKTMICMWIAGGATHFFHTILKATADVDFETAPNKEDPDDQWENKDPNASDWATDIIAPAAEAGAEGAAERRRLLAAAHRDYGRRPVAVAWPSPAGFFEVAGLHCNGSHVVVRSPFRVYEAARLPQDLALGPLAEVDRVEAAAVLCGLGRCDVLARGGGAWRLKPLGGALPGVLGEQVPIPADWRLAAGAWVDCRPSPCLEAALAGWDGSRIVLGGMRRSGVGAWRFRQWSSLDLGAAAAEGHCPAARGGATAAAPARCRAKDSLPTFRRTLLQALDGQQKNKRDIEAEKAKDPLEDVRRVVALHLDLDLQMLAVLHRGGAGSTFLTGWDATSGGLLGRWRTNGHHTSVCRSGHELLLAGAGGAQGPVLESLALPGRLRRRAGGSGDAEAWQEDGADISAAAASVQEVHAASRRPSP